MASASKELCVFFARGACRNGDSCMFYHGQNTNTQGFTEAIDPTSSVVKRVGLSPSHTTYLNEVISSPKICTFYMKGGCSRGDKCSFVHHSPITPLQQIGSSVASQKICLGDQPKSSSHTTTDSRANIPCKFDAGSSGCRNDSCPYLHTVFGREIEKVSNKEFKMDGDNDEEHEDDFTRKLSGAIVSFDEIGRVLKVSLPTDFSIACISGVAPGATAEALADLLRSYGYEISPDCIRGSEYSTSSGLKVLVKVENPLFAEELSAKLKEDNSNLSAVSLPTDSKKSDCRKVHISWHRSTRTAWVNFGNGIVAGRVAEKFNNNSYDVFGQSVRSSPAKHSGGFTYNPVAWTITLNDVPGNATSRDIEAAIKLPRDRPRHVEMGSSSYRASDAEVSVEVRSLLEEHGRLQSFYCSLTSKGKRVKTAAIFQEEADAQSACSLNDRRLSSLGKGKLTVTLVQSAKIKIQTTFYQVLKSRIDEESKTWKEDYVMIRTYTSLSCLFTTLKIESDNVKGLARARKRLDEILSGIVIQNGEDIVWAPAFNTNGDALSKLKEIEKDLNVVIYRNKPKRRLHFYGPSEKLQQTTARVVKLLRDKSCASYEIDLSPEHFSWMVRGGFKSIQEALGKGVTVLNVVSKRITINGTPQQHETALAIIRDKGVASAAIPDVSSLADLDCPICFCLADSPLQTACKHVYCLGCFEDYCRSAASMSRTQFQIKCQGDRGTCPTVFTLQSLKEWLSSSVFEGVLKSSFDNHVCRHPEAFRYCPTPDCEHIYRCTLDTGLKRPSYSCPNCLELICTFCHVRHGDYTCAEYKDIASGGYEALQRLKKELNVKDCPRCTTPMEKTEGCNHMECPGCRVHICWACMALFETSGPCYAHMQKEHGGIGVEFQH